MTKRTKRPKDFGIEWRTPYEDRWRSWGWYSTDQERDRRVAMLKPAYPRWEFRAVERTTAGTAG